MTDIEGVVIIVGMLCVTVFFCFIAWINRHTQYEYRDAQREYMKDK